MNSSAATFVLASQRRTLSSLLSPPTRQRLVERSFSSTTTKIAPIVELREYELYPEHATTYLQATNDSAALRQSLSPLRLFSVPETGGRLHTATHLYYYQGGHTQRDATRQNMAQNPEWKAYVSNIRPYAQTQSSTIWVEAPLVREHSGQVHGLSEVPNTQNLPGDASILEIRRYRLQLGYDTVPKFLELYGSGLPSKLNATGTDPTTSLVTVLYTEVGRLNEVIEIWRHGNGSTAMEVSRQAARGVPEWRAAIANIANLAIEFTSTIHKPTSFSPIQ